MMNHRVPTWTASGVVLITLLAPLLALGQEERRISRPALAPKPSPADPSEVSDESQDPWTWHWGLDSDGSVRWLMPRGLDQWDAYQLYRRDPLQHPYSVTGISPWHAGITIQIAENGDVKFYRDGRAVAEDRVVRTDERIALLDDDGREVIALERRPSGGIVAPAGSLIRIPLDIHGARNPRPYIGITMSRVSDALAAQLGLDPEAVVLVAGVRDGAAAARAGFQEHDIVTRVGGESPVTQEIIRRAVHESEKGDTIRFEILRAGRPLVIECAVDVAEPPPVQARIPGSVADPAWGFTPLTPSPPPGAPTLDADLRRLEARLEHIEELTRRALERLEAASKERTR